MTNLPVFTCSHRWCGYEIPPVFCEKWGFWNVLWCVQTLSFSFPEKKIAKPVDREKITHNVQYTSAFMFLVQPPATMLLWVCKTFPKKKKRTQTPNSCWTHWSRNGLHPFPFRMRKINGFFPVFPVAYQMKSPHVVGSLGPLWIICSEGVSCSIRKL